eukprot:CAMPEP_0184042518 /NCGR_PEP_ID=MMETSP0955-20130417/66383_1 /TAXON_ID=627963 /ORGANISM="Aplanochytrium sp, Strain PBS07" /LENGTH=273 /DNA_ID=CAMNT_0026333287 /DNA_START=422 /DNA_END=1244 /DNA_ORIENTATION=+
MVASMPSGDVSSLYFEDFKALAKDPTCDLFQELSSSDGSSSESEGPDKVDYSFGDTVCLESFQEPLFSDLTLDALLDVDIGEEVHPNLGSVDSSKPVKSESKSLETQVKSEMKKNKEVQVESKSSSITVENISVKRSLHDSEVLADGDKPVQKRKRRKRAKTAEEKRQRAIERKIKNRESAMRSRQKVLNEVKETKEKAAKLEAENEKQKSLLVHYQSRLSNVEAENARLKMILKSLRDSNKSNDIGLYGSVEPVASFSNVDCYNDTAVIGAV